MKEEQAALAKAEADRLAIEKKAANQRLAANSVQQASNLVLGATKLVAAEASKGLVGILTAAGGLALLFSIIAQAKSNAAQFSKPQRLREGTRLEGPSHERGGIPLFTPSHFYEAEGGEWLIGTKRSKKHDRFLASLNKGRYDNIDLYEAVENAHQDGMGRAVRGARKGRYTLNRHEQEIKDDAIKEVLREEFRGLGDRIEKVVVEELGRRPIDTPLDRPIKREYMDGNQRIEKIIKPT